DWIVFFLNACNRMASRIHSKLEQAEILARSGLEKCEHDSEKNVWLYTFADPFTTAKKASQHIGVAPNTARNALKSLADKQLLFADAQTKRNKKYRNYDLMRILRD